MTSADMIDCVLLILPGSRLLHSVPQVNVGLEQLDFSSLHVPHLATPETGTVVGKSKWYHQVFQDIFHLKR